MTDFAWPKKVPNLDQVPSEWHGAYEQHGDGGFRLLPEIAEACAEAEAEFAAQLAERDARIDHLRAETDSVRAENKSLLVESTIDAVLRLRGVPEGLRPGALAYLTADLPATAREGRAYIRDDHGEIELATAVHRWLDTVGVAFLPPAPPAPGPCSQAISRLREVLH